MSVVPNSTLPKCTRTAVIDLLFMRKYDLTHSQMLILYYLLMLKNWVKFKEDDFFVILSSKIERDLKLHPKTVEASLTKLKKLNLIDTKRVKVEEWNKNRTYRAISVTSLGKEYNLSFYKEKDYQYAKELEKENEAFRVENSEINAKNMQLSNINSDLELKKGSLDLELKAQERLNEVYLKAIKEKKELEDKLFKMEIENRELKKELSLKEKEPKEQEKRQEEDIDKFRKKVIREYAQSGKPVTNAIQNSDNWSIETKFYINSYSRLSTYLPNGKHKQIVEPKAISNFWKWLYYHQYRVGSLLDTKKVADISLLEPFLGKRVLIDNKTYNIEKLTPVVGGVKLIISNDIGDLINIGNGYGSYIIDVRKCKEWFDLYSTE